MKGNRGFTLIELLVVIAIIGILSSVVLASLNTARGKGADAAIKANLANARAQAELYYDTEGDYADVCTVDTGILSAVTAASATCVDDTGFWVATSQLDTAGTFFCVDSEGSATTTAAAVQSTGTACDDLN
jgi:prepilin-type N-terminal cleavage/methylation domain-containing protein